MSGRYTQESSCNHGLAPQSARICENAVSEDAKEHNHQAQRQLFQPVQNSEREIERERDRERESLHHHHFEIGR